MYLKRLDVQGFKSFADKVSLDFHSGITSVVGPNGSGKSNISDSIRWVLGEQSAKTLRGGKMEDVIFAGTEHRKPLGFAEVSVTIDNESGRLPLAFSEVTVTRRVYRSGESEYLINKSPCRLKDIHELFMDTGIGRDGYSIIGQGRVDEILSSRSEDRRAIFEEASGIMKYKTRKIEAEKKLDQSEQNLVRINDIILELEVQLAPLEKQAETAKKYLSLRDQLKEIEVSVYVENIGRLQQKLTEFEEKFKIATNQIEEETQKLEIKDKDSKEGLERARLLEEKANILRQEFFEIESSIEKNNSEIALENEKIQHVRENIAKADTDYQEFKVKISEVEKDRTHRIERQEYLVKRKEEYTLELEKNTVLLEKIVSKLDEKEKHIENLKSSIIDKMDLISDKKTQIASIKSHAENFRIRENNIITEIYQINLERDKDNIKKEELETNINKLIVDIEYQREKIDELTEEQKDSASKFEEEKKKLNQIRNDIQFKTSRQKMLQNMERNFEGYHRSVKSILQECQRNDQFSKGIHGALAQLVSVDKTFATAIEMVLGGALQNIVTGTEEDAKKGIDYLKRNKIGRATFLPISSVKGKYLEKHYVDDLKTMPNFCGVASDLVTCSDEVKDIVLNLLGRVIVVKDLDTGIAIAKKHKYSFRIVTLDGDILSTSGSMSGGSNENRESGLLNRGNEINQIEEELAKLQSNDELAQCNIKELASMIAEILKEIEELEALLKNSELTQIRDESHLGQIEENLLRSQSRIDLLKNEKDQLSRQNIDIQSEIGKYQNELEKLEKEIQETRTEINEYVETHKEGQEERDTLHENITDMKIALGSTVDSLESTIEALVKIEQDFEELQKLIARRQQEKEIGQIKIDELLKSIEVHKAKIEELERLKESKNIEIQDSQKERREAEASVEKFNKEIHEINKNLRLLGEEQSRIEVNKARSESDIDSIRNRLWDDYELTYTNAMENKREIDNLATAQKQIQELKNGIRELGAVNVGAIEEYSKTKERFEFMFVQREDLLGTKETLGKVIEEMTNIMKKQFLDQFKLINENFGKVFRELFDGGRAELILVDPQNVLESGIEIEVQPPGKKLQNMMLLSGGERAFTAIALLFAILKLRPTPFCLLDEIEAALDEANVNRFASYIKKHTALTQFLVITHRKGTMESSDSLYGVTMQEHGISKVVSMRLGDKMVN